MGIEKSYQFFIRGKFSSKHLFPNKMLYLSISSVTSLGKISFLFILFKKNNSLVVREYLMCVSLCGGSLCLVGLFSSTPATKVFNVFVMKKAFKKITL